MKRSVLQRPLASLLSLLMVIGLFTICGFGTLAENTVDSAVIQSWDVSQLKAAATEKGTTNSHGKPIFEEVATILGRNLTTVGGSWLFHSAWFNTDQFHEGDKVEISFRLWFHNEKFGNSNPVEPQWVFSEPGTKTWVTETQMKAAEEKTDPVYGYKYKEVSSEYTVTAADIAAGAEKMQLRVFINGDENVDCYGAKVVNKTTGVTLADWDGAGINGLGFESNPSSTVTTLRCDSETYLASYAGPETYTIRTTEPYASYNCDGLNGEAVLMDSLGVELEEGRYAFTFNMASQYSLGEKKATYRVKDGDKVLAEQTIMLADVEATVGGDSGKFELRTLPFTVDAESAGNRVTFEIVLHNETDYSLKGVSLAKYFDPASISLDQIAASADSQSASYDRVMGGEGGAELVGLTFNGAQDIALSDLAVGCGIVGQYAFQASISTTAAPNATLHVYVMEDGSPVEYATVPFTANTQGQAMVEQVKFNVTAETAGKSFAFGFELADGSAMTLQGLTLVRLGDVADLDPVLIKEWSGQDLADNAEAKFKYNYELLEASVGYRIDGFVALDPENPDTATALTQWSRADIMTGALEEGTIMPDDEIRYGGYFEYDQGLDDTAGVGFTMMYGDFTKEFGNGGMNMNSSAFMALEEMIDETYGFAYRDVFNTYTIASQEEADAIIASGFKILIGDFTGPHYDVSPQTVYGFYVYNVTQDLYLFQKNGAELLNYGWTKNGDYVDTVKVEYADTSKVVGVTFQQADVAQAVLKAPLTTQVGTAGSYRLDLKDLAITGEGSVTVEAGALVDGVLVPTAYKVVTNDDAVVEFNVTGDMAAYPVGFAIRQDAKTTTSLSSVSLSYLGMLDASEDNADVAAAFEVAKLIAKLPVNITLAEEEAVTAAKTAFDGLTEAQQALVANAGVLENAGKIIEELKAGKEAADTVIAKVAALPEAEALTLENETAVNEAKAAYDALSDTVKTLVDEAAVTKLNAAVEKIAELKADKEAADAVIAMINALPEASAITEDDRADVEAARDAYDKLTDTQKALVDVLAKLEAAEAALDGGDITYGDVNDDGSVNASDALECLQHSVKLKTLEGDAFTAADVDLSGTVNATDALYILQFSVKLIDTLPVK